MEFRNHQTKILHQYRNLAGNPLAVVLFGLVFLAILIPFIFFALIGICIAVIAIPIRIALASLFGKRASSPFPPNGYGTVARPRGDNDPDDDLPEGPIIDVEVTRSNPLP